MITLRPGHERGHARLAWLESRHSFSFGQYHDPRYMGLSILRVINEDVIGPGGGFAMHGHEDMEIVTYMLRGQLAHRDSLGNGSVIGPGEVQHMSAGTGVRHSEFNASNTESAHLLQIWLLPNRLGGEPGYSERRFPLAERRRRLRVLVSPDGRDDSIPAHQDGVLYGTWLGAGESVTQPLAAGRLAYVHLARGQALVNGVALAAGDAATIREDAVVELAGRDDEAELLLFDLPDRAPG